MEILIYSYCAIALLTAIMETRAFIENQREKNKPVLSREDLKFYGVSDDEIDDFTKIENEEKTERAGLLQIYILRAPFWIFVVTYEAVISVQDYITARRRRSYYSSPKTNDQLYTRLTRKWVKTATRNLRRKNSSTSNASTLIKSLGSIGHEKLYQYQFGSFLCVLDRCGEHQNFESVYQNCRSEEAVAFSNRLEEERKKIAKERGAKHLYITWDLSIFEDRFVVVTKGLRKALYNFDQKTRKWIKEALDEIDYSEVLEPIEGEIAPIENSEGVEQYIKDDKRLVYRFDRKYDKIVMISFDLGSDGRP